MSIKYYRLAKGETPPEEFCAVRDVGGEPSEYVFYVPDAENAKLRELVRILVHCMDEVDNCDSCPINGNPYDVSKEWAACDTLREMLCELVAEADE